tara:strand:+ start:11983 stop:12147 length:165 start_codon:yes stop_codon:yes gene_type:complete
MKFLSLLALLMVVFTVSTPVSAEDCEAINDGSRGNASTTVIETEESDEGNGSGR